MATTRCLILASLLQHAQSAASPNILWCVRSPRRSREALPDPVAVAATRAPGHTPLYTPGLGRGA